MKSQILRTAILLERYEFTVEKVRDRSDDCQCTSDLAAGRLLIESSPQCEAEACLRCLHEFIITSQYRSTHITGNNI
jgi:hypothetical protein